LNRVASPPAVLQDGRLRLRGLDARDVDALFELYADARVMRHWSFARWTVRSQAIAHVERLARDRELLEVHPWAATIDGEDRLVGTCTLFGIHRDRARGVVSYALAPALWGRGLGHAMLSLVLDHGFGALALERIEADIDGGNVASRRLAERLGFTCERIMHERHGEDGGLRETLCHALSGPAWRASRARVDAASPGAAVPRA